MFRARFISGLYRLLTIAASPFLLIYAIRRVVADRRYGRGLSQRFGFLPPSFQRTVRDSIWLHAVSAGEVLSAVELVRRLRQALPDAPVFVSTGTLAGLEAAESRLSGLVDGVFPAPFDLVFSVRRVIRRIRPAALVIVETEIWPNLWRECKRAGCALVVVNGRISDKAAGSYARHAWFFGSILSLADAILVQSEQDRTRYLAAGAPESRISVAGNLKYDFDPSHTALPDAIGEWIALSDAPLWIAASTVAPQFQGDVDEDDAVIDAWRALPGTRLLVAPRKPERFDIVADKWAAAGIPFARRSTLPDNASAPVLVLDSIGELSAAYPFARVVFMGGTIARRGGHNLLEPALFGKPVVAGTSMENFAAIQQRFRNGRGFVEVEDPRELADAIRAMLADGHETGTRGRAIAEAERGATDKAVQEIVDTRWNAVPRAIPSLAARALAWLWIAGGVVKRRITRVRRLPSRVISVGGLAMGGSGKTPVVRMLASRLPDPAVLTRGYRRDQGEPVTILAAGEHAPVAITGDEAQLILRDGQAQVGIASDRFQAGSRMSASVFLLDDGFQHAQLHRDLDLVLLDGLDPLAGGYPFPAGRLRETTASLDRADAIIITRTEGRRFDGLLRMLPAGTPVFYGTTEIAGWIACDKPQVLLSPDALRDKDVYAFCGIGNPESFRRSLLQCGCRITGFRVFTDHHGYTDGDLHEIEASAGNAVIVTTEKDAVRLPRPLGFALLIRAEVPGLLDFIVSVS